MKYSRFIVTTLLFFMGFLNIFSQSRVKCGGKTEKQQKCAPIKSTELRSLSTDFTIFSRAYKGFFDGKYSLNIQPTKAGKYQFSCNNETVLVSADVLKEVQNIIKRYNLEKSNGLYSVTAGLPPECQPMHFTAEYASGEKLSFTVNNNPYSEWTILLFRYFRDVLLANGNTKYALDVEKYEIHRLILEYSYGDGIVHRYGNIISGDNKENLFRMVYDQNKNEVVSNERIPIPSNHYSGLTELVEKLSLPWIANEKSYVKQPDATKESFCRIYANDADLNPIFSTTYRGYTLSNEVKYLIEQLCEYMDKPFEKK